MKAQRSAQVEGVSGQSKCGEVPSNCKLGLLNTVRPCWSGDLPASTPKDNRLQEAVGSSQEQLLLDWRNRIEAFSVRES